MGNNWLICGTSPYTCTGSKGAYSLVRDIPQGFTTIGLNHFPAECDYRFIVDYPIVKECYNYQEKLIIPDQLLPVLRCYNSVGRESLLIQPHYVFTIGKELDCINSVCEPAIQYASQQGADAIILFGVDLTSDWQPTSRTEVTKQIIYKYPNVYKLNEKSEVDVPLWNKENLS